MPLAIQSNFPVIANVTLASANRIMVILDDLDNGKGLLASISTDAAFGVAR
jgi:adenosine/AMP kinase